MAEQPLSSLTLHTAQPRGLRDPAVRRNVEAAAHALGERMGVPLHHLHLDDSTAELSIGGPPIVALGFGAELRRSTDRWHHAHYGTRLWRENR